MREAFFGIILAPFVLFGLVYLENNSESGKLRIQQIHKCQEKGMEYTVTDRNMVLCLKVENP